MCLPDGLPQREVNYAQYNSQCVGMFVSAMNLEIQERRSSDMGQTVCIHINCIFNMQ